MCTCWRKLIFIPLWIEDYLLFVERCWERFIAQTVLGRTYRMNKENEGLVNFNQNCLLFLSGTCYSGLNKNTFWHCLKSRCTRSLRIVNMSLVLLLRFVYNNLFKSAMFHLYLKKKQVVHAAHAVRAVFIIFRANPIPFRTVSCSQLVWAAHKIAEWSESVVLSIGPVQCFATLLRGK